MIDETVRDEPGRNGRTFYTIQQIAERHPAFTVRTLRHWIYNSQDRFAWKGGRRHVIAGNGFARVILKKGRRIYIDEAALLEWLEAKE